MSNASCVRVDKCTYHYHFIRTKRTFQDRSKSHCSLQLRIQRLEVHHGPKAAAGVKASRMNGKRVGQRPEAEGKEHERQMRKNAKVDCSRSCYHAYPPTGEAVRTASGRPLDGGKHGIRAHRRTHTGRTPTHTHTHNTRTRISRWWCATAVVVARRAQMSRPSRVIR